MSSYKGAFAKYDADGRLPRSRDLKKHIDQCKVEFIFMYLYLHIDMHIDMHVLQSRTVLK